MESILTSIKKLLGIGEDYDHFDADIIMHINGVFFILRRIGVGPEEGFFIKDTSTLWTDFFPEGEYEAIKTYVYMKVKLIFDPPLNASILESMKQLINEYEFSLGIEADSE